MTINGVQFASSMVDESQNRNRLNLAPHVSEAVRTALAALPYFKYVDTPDLLKEATDKLRGKKYISDRVTAMLVIAGTRYLNHPELQRERKQRDIGQPCYAK